MGRAAHLMTDTVTVASVTAIDAGATKTYGAQVEIAARVEPMAGTVQDAAGVAREAKTYIVSESEIMLSDRVWPPGADTADANEAERVITVASASTPDGYTLYEAWL